MAAIEGPADGLAKTLGFATAIQIIATAAALSLTAIVPLVVADVGLDVHFVGFQISLIYLAATLASAGAGGAIERLGALRVEQLCLFTFGCGLLCFATARVEGFVAGSLIVGIGYGWQNPAASQLLASVVNARTRNLVYSVKQAGVPLGGVIASLAIPALAVFIDWRLVLVLASIVPFAALAALRYYSHADDARRVGAGTARRSGFFIDQKILWADPRLAGLALIGFFYSVVQLSLSAFAVTTLVEDGAWPLVTAGAVAAAMQFAGAGGRIGWGWVADRIGGGMRVLALLGLLGGLGSLALYLAIDMAGWVQLLLFIWLGAVWLGWNGVLLAEVAHQAPVSQVGQATGAVLVYVFGGVIIGPAGFALVAAGLTSFSATFAVYSLCGFLGALAALRLDFSARPKEIEH
ncbi:MFS transporter [Salinisphaera aquimarina]|uniref:MFS transporter n=1 Tax=Salinisphaera aquimarina TaxID=2094031 RepID=A0ABV7EQP8_9GAMM